MDMNKKEGYTAPLLEIRNLSVEYTSEKRVIHAVNDLSLTLGKGETLCLVGETGAGKTTTAKSILRILPNPPARYKSGEIFFNGEDILKMGDQKLRSLRGNNISMIFQDPMTALNPTMRIGQQIAAVIELHQKVKKSEAKKRAVKMLSMVGISEDRYMEYPHQFSGGMKQRVIIAAALACNPDLLLADEPTTALDVTIQAQVLQMVRNLRAEKNTSMILITHDLGVVAEMADNVAIVYAGEIIEYGSLEEIFDHSSHPYTLGLFRAIPDVNCDMEALVPIEGMPPDPSNLPKGCKFSPRCEFVTEECLKGDIGMVSLGGTHQCRCCHAETVKQSRIQDKDGIYACNS